MKVHNFRAIQGIITKFKLDLCIVVKNNIQNIWPRKTKGRAQKPKQDRKRDGQWYHFMSNCLMAGVYIFLIQPIKKLGSQD
jgi:hypothetical protein